MTETAIGMAKMALTLDTADYDIAIERSKQKQQGLGTVAQQEAEKMTAAQRRVIASLDNQITKLGLTREQWLQYKVITQTTGETQAALLSKIKANSAAIEQQGATVKKAGIEFNQYGLSAKQTQAALRQVPAQMTDIFVSLQGGQNPLTVLLQQGGQLKDVFGGIVPAARALGSAVLGLVNPYTVLAAVIGTIGLAYLQGEQRTNAFNQALILTGQQGALTADQLDNIATRLDNLSGVTSRQAAAALTQVVANGRIAASQYELVTQAAVMMEDATGKAVQETISEYADLARDPVSAVLRLNESENFLTASVYERIRAMQDAGDIEGAAALATEARAAAQIERAKEVVESLGLVSGAWHSIKQNTGEAWDEAVSYFSNLDRDAKEAVGTLGRLWAAFKAPMGAMPWAIRGALTAPTGGGGSTASVAGSPDPKVNAAVQRQLDALIVGNRSREQRQELEEKQIVNLYKQLGISKEDKRVQDQLAASRERYKESLPKGKDGSSAARSLANAEASAALQAIKDQEEVQRSEIQNTSKVLQAEYGARLVTTTDYYAKQRDLVTRDFAAQEQSLVKQIEFLRSRDVAGKDSVNVQKQLGELEAKLAKIRADGATQLTILGIQEQDVANKRKRAVDAYRESLDTANEAARQQADASLARIILGEREAAQQEKLAAITADYADKQRQLAREFAETNDYAAYQEKSNALTQFMEEQVRIAQDGYARMREAESDWLNGFKGGIAQWAEGAQNVAAQANAITKRSLDGATDMLTNFAMTGKLTWRDLLRDIGEQIVKFMMQQAVLGFIKMFASYWTGGTDAAATTTDWGAFTPNAKGNVYSSPSLSAYSGKVVDKPTPFYFAKGAGVMGEAGMEGIFPLQRGSDGKLGVKAIGGGAQAPVYVTTNVTVNSDGSTNATTQTAGGQAAMYRELASNMSTVAQKEITRAIMPGGIIWKARGGKA